LLTNFKGAVPLKVILALTPLAAHHVAKFHEATLPGSKVLAANTLHFKPIFDPSLKKVVRKPPSSVGVC